VFGTEMLHSSK